MPQMPLAAGAMHFGPAHEQAAVFLFFDHLVVRWLIKRRPACSTIEFMRLIEQGDAAALAGEDPFFLGEIVIGKGTFGPMLAQNLVFQIVQLRAPFGIGFHNFVHQFPRRQFTLHVAWQRVSDNI